MKKPSVAFLSALVLLAATTPLFAQNSEEISGKAAEQAGRLREALTHYVAALQSAPDGSADDQRLREAIIKLVQKLSPPPAVPEEARRFSVRGQIAVKEAKSPSDFDEAAKEFGKALRVAPWWADGYINQGVALEKAGKFSEAARSLKFYLLAAPNAPDAQNVKDQIYALEYRQEKAQKDAVALREEQERKQKEQDAYQRNLGFLVGRWIGTRTTHFERLNPPGHLRTSNITVDITINGKEVTVTLLDTESPKVILVGRVAGNDYTSIRWELPAGDFFAHESVSVQISPSRIYFSSPSLLTNTNQRYEGFQEYDLQKR